MDSAERVFILSMILVRRHFLYVVAISCAVGLICGAIEAFIGRHKTCMSLYLR